MMAEQHLLSVPELSHHLAESYLTCCLYLQEMLQYKRQNHGKVRPTRKQISETVKKCHVSYTAWLRGASRRASAAVFPVQISDQTQSSGWLYKALCSPPGILVSVFMTSLRHRIRGNYSQTPSIKVSWRASEMTHVLWWQLHVLSVFQKTKIWKYLISVLCSLCSVLRDDVQRLLRAGRGWTLCTRNHDLLHNR